MGEGLIHVLLVSFPGQGHVNPLLRLAKKLASKGLLVTFSTTEGFAHFMQKATNNTTTITTTNSPIPIGKGYLRFEFFPDGLDIDDERRNDLDAWISQLNLVGPKSLADLIDRQAAEGRRVSCVINNAFVPWVVDVAHDMDIPCGVLWVQSCVLFSVYYHYHHNLSKFPTSPESDFSVQLPGMPPLKGSELPSFLLSNNPYKILTEVILGQFKNLWKASWVMVDSFEELERPILESVSQLVPIKLIGPLFKSIDGVDGSAPIRADLWKAADCLEWLDTQPKSSVVYVSFGSIVALGSDQLEEMAWGLKKSGCPFLWVARPAPGSTDKGLPPKWFLEETEGKGKVVEWCPQEQVLSHPSVACFVTHCGWNSSMESITTGVPVIAFPQWGDQITNAKFLSEVYRIGVWLGSGEGGPLVTREEIQRCVAEITDGGPRAEEIKKNSLKWKEAAEKAVGPGGSSHDSIQAILDDVRSRAVNINEPKVPV